MVLHLFSVFTVTTLHGLPYIATPSVSPVKLLLSLLLLLLLLLPPLYPLSVAGMTVKELVIQPTDLLTKVFQMGLRVVGINNLKVVIGTVSE